MKYIHLFGGRKWLAVFLANSRKSPTCDLAQMVKKLTAIQLTLVLSLGREDSLEKRMATHSSILLRTRCFLGLPVDRGPWQATIRGVTKSQTRLVANTTTQKSKVNFGGMFWFCYPDTIYRLDFTKNKHSIIWWMYEVGFTHSSKSVRIHWCVPDVNSLFP